MPDQDRSRKFLLVGALVSVTLLLAACQTVFKTPARTSPSDTLLVVPLELENQTGKPYPLVFTLTYDGVDDWRAQELINFDEDYGFITILTPGSHTITAISVRWQPTNEILQKLNLNIPFSLTAGEALILPLRFRIVVQTGGSRLFVDDLNPAQVDEARSTLLKDYKNADAWFPRS